MTVTNGTGVYRWVIMILLTVLGAFGGFVVQGERLSERVVTNTVKIDTLEKQYLQINMKLDKLLEQRSH